MPGRHITNRQYKDYMKLRTKHTQTIAAAKAGFSQSIGQFDQLIRNLHRPTADRHVNEAGHLDSGVAYAFERISAIAKVKILACQLSC